MRKIIYISIMMLLLAISFHLNSNPQSKVSIITNKSLNLNSLTTIELIEIYTLNRKFWDDDTRIVIVDMKGENECKSSFYELLEMDYTELQKIWLRKQFSGAGIPPKVFKTSEEIIEMVAQTEGAIAYIPSEMVSNKIKVITIE